MRIADKKGMTLDAAMEEMSSSEFIWQEAMMEAEPNEFHWLKWYLATLHHRIFELPFAFWGKESGLQPKDFLIEFKAPSPEPQLTAEELEEKKRAAAADLAAHSKSVWGGLAATQQAKKAAAKKKKADRQARVEKARAAHRSQVPGKGGGFRHGKNRGPGSKKRG
jgi:hypothetical protein